MRQNTEEWYKIRRGRVTASEVKRIMANGKGEDGLSIGARTYMYELLAELLTNESDSQSSPSIEWGTENEAEARLEYEIRTGNEVTEVGFIKYDGFNDLFGGSPDGLISEKGGVEIKCPNTKTHILNFLGESQSTNYKYQIQSNILINNLEWIDFISYDPRVVDYDKKMYIERINRDEEIIDKIKEKLSLFIDVYTEKLKKLNLTIE